ncbi:unnamed protein product [Lactuca saligna]|uniref:Uncharacterized protein n=1 Tax=Lactuca saligna TaxID=75948 RepID=A0AA35ZF37_LACSI|nr:unnamed protein product [Lactuca saligna]
MPSLPAPIAIHILRATETSSRVQWLKTFSSILDGENGLEAVSTSKIAKLFAYPYELLDITVAKFTPVNIDGESGEPTYIILDRSVESVRMLRAGSGMGVMCGMTRGIKMARPPSSSIMNSTTGLLTSSTPTPTPAQGNSMLRSREAMHMIRFAFEFQFPSFNNLPKSLQPNKEQQ